MFIFYLAITIGMTNISSVTFHPYMRCDFRICHLVHSIIHYPYSQRNRPKTVLEPEKIKSIHWKLFIFFWLEIHSPTEAQKKVGIFRHQPSDDNGIIIPSTRKFFFNPLGGREGYRTDLCCVPDTQPPSESSYELCILLGFLLVGFYAADLPAHLHTFSFGKFSPLMKSEVYILPLFFRTERETGNIDSHYAVDLALIIEKSKPLLLKVDIDTIVYAPLYRFENFPYCPAHTAQFAY